MTKSPRYLTKSRFKLGSECPTKLYYTRKKKQYADRKQDDSFLAALAEGGFQVGELAKLYFPGGHDITTLDYEESLRQTNEFLTQKNVIIYEAAIRYENLFIRADVLVKKGSQIHLIEVKAKSCDPSDTNFFVGKNGGLVKGWIPYLEDVAFQRYVIGNAFSEFEVRASLMLADKSATCSVDGLNQKFKITTDGDGRKGVSVSKNISEADLSSKLLCVVPVDELCDRIENLDGVGDVLDLPFEKRIQYLSEYYARDEKIHSSISMACGRCEFDCDEGNDGLKSGKKECFKKQLGWSDADFRDSTIFEIWNLHIIRKTRFLEESRIKMCEIIEVDIEPQGDGRPGISQSERQWRQIEKANNRDGSIWMDKQGLRSEMASWEFPLHFIDFETSAVAIPFNKGMRPYEGVAFQFSHHVVYEDGRVEHLSEYLNTERGVFPSFDFVRKLKKSLDQDKGSIFRYSNHENTYLNLIYRQLKRNQTEVPDCEELCEFIRSITKSTKKSVEQWEGERSMIDLWDLVKRYYYDPATKGSNSIKQVLPAIINSSEYLKSKYSKPIYGAEGGIPSKHFKDWVWIEVDELGVAQDPYKRLPKMFRDIDPKILESMDLMSDSDELNDGGAALTAYARLQFEEMSDLERSEIHEALLKYCELDTMAMVMIYEAWREMVA